MYAVAGSLTPRQHRCFLFLRVCPSSQVILTHQNALIGFQAKDVCGVDHILQWNFCCSGYKNVSDTLTTQIDRQTDHCCVHQCQLLVLVLADSTRHCSPPFLFVPQDAFPLIQALHSRLGLMSSCWPGLTSWAVSLLTHVTEVCLGHQGNYRPILSCRNKSTSLTNTLSCSSACHLERWWSEMSFTCVLRGTWRCSVLIY